MDRRFPTLLLLTALSVYPGGCTSTPKLKPEGQVIVPADPSAPRVQAKAKVLNEVVVSLPAIEQRGHEWVIVFNDARYLRPIGSIEPASAGGFTMRFLAVHAGRRGIRFFALPPGIKESSPSQRYEVLIEIE